VLFEMGTRPAFHAALGPRVLPGTTLTGGSRLAGACAVPGAQAHLWLYNMPVA
jgi:hypothetical protein